MLGCHIYNPVTCQKEVCGSNLHFMEQAYPQDHWMPWYTDHSADESDHSVGGIYISQTREQPSSKPFQQESSLQTVWLKQMRYQQWPSWGFLFVWFFFFWKKEVTYPKLVIFSDALSVLQALQNPNNKEMDTLVSCLIALQQSSEENSHPVDPIPLQYPREQWS